MEVIQWQDGVQLPGLKSLHGTGCGAIHQGGRVLYVEAGDLVLLDASGVICVVSSPTTQQYALYYRG